MVRQVVCSFNAGGSARGNPDPDIQAGHRDRIVDDAERDARVHGRGISEEKGHYRR